ncbi:hypothetical protein F4782DRAFT_527469 [Xylaria castorea]|nr:hypothetical protein F4782DRAFT_527469 [Xylaria castorea]
MARATKFMLLIFLNYRLCPGVSNSLELESSSSDKCSNGFLSICEINFLPEIVIARRHACTINRGTSSNSDLKSRSPDEVRGHLSLPTRVIDLQNQRLTTIPKGLRLHISDLEEEDYYAALSHRWGDKFPFQTTQSILLERQEGFSLGELPESF